MPDSLLIYYSPLQADDLSWSTFNDEGELTSSIQTGDIEALRETASGQHCTVILDAALTSAHRLELPALNQQKLMRAIPFAMEEYIADDVEDFHFIASPCSDETSTAVVSINRNSMDAVMEQLGSAGLEIDSMVPESLCLAADDLQWCILIDGEQAIIQTDSSFGGRYDLDMIDMIVGAELTRTENRPTRVLVFHLDGETPPDIALGTDEIEVVQISYNTHPMVIYCSNLKRSLTNNLLQHDYKRNNKKLEHMKRWALAASLAFVWLILSIGLKGYQLHELQQANASIENEMISIYRSSFPKSKRIVNARVQMEQKLNELRAGGGNASKSMVGLLANSSKAIASERAVELKSVSFKNGRLDLSFSSKNLNAIQNLNNKLNQTSGIKAEIISSSSEKNSVIGSIRIQPS